TPVTITAAGFETFNVTPSSQELGLIQSDLTINTGRVASVFINDQNGAALAGHSVPATYSVLPFTIFTQSLVHEGLQVQSTNAAGRVFINGPGGLTLNGSSLNDTYNVDGQGLTSTPSNPIYLNTGTDHNTVNVCPTTHALGLLGADVTILGGGPTDVV